MANNSVLLTGNEAIARGAFEAGVCVATAYPGTPSTEILESIKGYEDIYSEWGTNEKVAYEVAYGAAIAGKRAFCSMKQVGLNVAADPFFTSVYTGVNAGFVFVTADEPGVFSSQNEQDNRNYAKAARCPVLEPVDSEECRIFVKKAYEISEKFDTPVMIRMTTRVCHTHSVVKTETRSEKSKKEYIKQASKRSMIPIYALERHSVVEERIRKIRDFNNKNDLNVIFNEKSKSDIGIICSSNAFNYVMECVGEDIPVLKLGMTYPLPDKTIEDFSKGFRKVLIIEENDDFLYDNIKILNIDSEILKKEEKFIIDELDIDKVREIISGKNPGKTEFNIPDLAPRPPQMCPSCPHRSVFYLLNKHKFSVSGDIGCYGLGVLPPFNGMDTIVCMGASVTMAHGFSLAGEHSVGVIGDSTFFHTGINGLINTFYNRGISTVLILDNSITAMTGGQINPSSVNGVVNNVSIEKVVKAIGIEYVKVIDAYDVKTIEEELKLAKKNDIIRVLIIKQPCIMIRKDKIGDKVSVDQDKCIKCGLCIKAGCPAITMKDGKIEILQEFCLGCGVCGKICPKEAIS